MVCFGMGPKLTTCMHWRHYLSCAFTMTFTHNKVDIVRYNLNISKLRVLKAWEKQSQLEKHGEWKNGTKKERKPMFFPLAWMWACYLLNFHVIHDATSCRESLNRIGHVPKYIKMYIHICLIFHKCFNKPPSPFTKIK